SEINHMPMPARSPAGHHPVTASLKSQVEALKAALIGLEATAAGHRADFERERLRAEQLLSELLRATEDAMTARENTARLGACPSNRNRETKESEIPLPHN